MLHDPSVVTASDQAFRSGAADIARLLVEIRPLVTTERGRQDAEAVSSGLAAWQPEYEQIASLCRAGQYEQAFQDRLMPLVDQTIAIRAGMKKASDDMADVQQGLLVSSRLPTESRPAVPSRCC